ncbi:hypothetical protein BD309DRAFT_1011044 [Dichomitus squalens]|uniref:Uncharacterized protein n=1 Tax=Dichomitus squalens TaxID=114155 RepID=A0A4Q9NJV2_9APHY|nr:hypothetical protein BD309DRAFT_1011044 [Dichomitus squalens]TBU52014.1 hypothetical protein BD310DRAFT_910320 [Dichomitus squalens]
MTGQHGKGGGAGKSEFTWEDVSQDTPPSLRADIVNKADDALARQSIQLEGPLYLSLNRFWPVSLWGVAFLIHRRFRQLSPRRLPTITPLKPPEIYGIFALAHLANVEAFHLREKVIRDDNLRTILAFSYAMRDVWNGALPTDDRLKKYDLSLRASPLLATLHEHLLSRYAHYTLWRWRNTWSDSRTRGFVGQYVADQVLHCELSAHDTAILLTVVAERTRMRDFHQPACVRKAVLTGHTLLDAFSYTLGPMLWRVATGRHQTLNTWFLNGIQRSFAYWAGDPEKAAMVIMKSVEERSGKSSGTSDERGAVA